MKAMITKDPGWMATYKGRKLQFALNSVLNGDLAERAVAENAAVVVPANTPVTPMILHKPAPKRKKANGAAPENKAEY